MPNVVGVVFHNGGRVYSYDAGSLALSRGEQVVVPTQRGQEVGEVVSFSQDVPREELTGPLKSVVRALTDEDRVMLRDNEELRQEALQACRKLIADHGLDMKLVDAEVLFGGGKILFSFFSEERVDFRGLVSDLARTLKTRIELRQIGAREEARMVGGLGPCGRALCCTRFQGDQEPVSIRMAKEQSLPLNPMKISGLCGRLMCCLKYEQEQYVAFRKEAPRCGTPVDCGHGEGVVIGYRVPKDSLTIRLADGSVVEEPIGGCSCGGAPCRASSTVEEAAECLPAPLPTAGEADYLPVEECAEAADVSTEAGPSLDAQPAAQPESADASSPEPAPAGDSDEGPGWRRQSPPATRSSRDGRRRPPSFAVPPAASPPGRRAGLRRFLGGVALPAPSEGDRRPRRALHLRPVASLDSADGRRATTRPTSLTKGARVNGARWGRGSLLLLGMVLALSGLLLFPATGRATTEFAQQTGKDCTYCHVTPGGPLTAQGDAFRANGNRLPTETTSGGGTPGQTVTSSTLGGGTARHGGRRRWRRGRRSAVGRPEGALAAHRPCWGCRPGFARCSCSPTWCPWWRGWGRSSSSTWCSPPASRAGASPAATSSWRGPPSSYWGSPACCSPSMPSPTWAP